MSCELGAMRSRRHHPSLAAPPPLDNDDLLSEILLRLSPQPSSLPRASLVCKRWHGLASDPGFSCRFRRHHRRSPPLLGFFTRDGNKLRFRPTLDPPNRIPQGRFSFGVDDGDRHFKFLGCRHGFLLMFHSSQGTLEILVRDPLNGHEHHIAIPPGFGEKGLYGAVFRAGLPDITHFQVVLVSTVLVSADDDKQRVYACVYSSETGVWGNLITTPLPPNISDISPAMIDRTKPAVLVKDSLYMFFTGESSSILEFNVDTQSLAVIPLPVGLHPRPSIYYSVLRAEGGGLGLLVLSTSDSNAQLWKRKIDCDGVSSWVLGRTIEIDNLLSWHPDNHAGLLILGFAEENNMVFLWVHFSIFMVQLDSLQFKKAPQSNSPYWHPFEGVYAQGI